MIVRVPVGFSYREYNLTRVADVFYFESGWPILAELIGRLPEREDTIFCVERERSSFLIRCAPRHLWRDARNMSPALLMRRGIGLRASDSKKYGKPWRITLKLRRLRSERRKTKPYSYNYPPTRIRFSSRTKRRHTYYTVRGV